MRQPLLFQYFNSFIKQHIGSIFNTQKDYTVMLGRIKDISFAFVINILMDKFQTFQGSKILRFKAARFSSVILFSLYSKLAFIVYTLVYIIIFIISMILFFIVYFFLQ